MMNWTILQTTAQTIITTSGWGDKASWILFLAGLLGGIIRAAASRHPTLSKRTGLDIFVGGLAPLVLTLFKLIPTEGANLLQLAAVGITVGLFGSYFLAWGLYKLGVFKEDIRAATPGDDTDLLRQQRTPPRTSSLSGPGAPRA